MNGLSGTLWKLWAAGEAEPQGQVLRPLIPPPLISLCLRPGRDNLPKRPPGFPRGKAS